MFRSELLGLPSDFSFCYLLLQLDVVAAPCPAIRDPTIAEIPVVAADLDHLVCDAKALRGLVEPTPAGGSAALGLAY
ncbi:hypothetical protein KBY96_15110 [Cyanobium sp. ATX 6A2]|nr:hypothetical protein [Cyanobium sp. ATX 6A2]